MQDKAAVPVFAIGIFVCLHLLVNGLQNGKAQIIGLCAVAKAILAAFQLHQGIHALVHAHHAEQAIKAITLQKALFHKEIAAEERRFLHQKTDLLVHKAAHGFYSMGQRALKEILLGSSGFHQLVQHQASQRVCAAANGQAVVAACNAVGRGELGGKLRVVCKAGLCAVQRGFGTQHSKFIAGFFGVI